MSKYFSQRGFTPIMVVIVLVIIGAASLTVIKNLPLNQPESLPSTPIKILQGSNSAQLKSKVSPTIIGKQTAKNITPTTAKKASPTPSITPSSSSNNNSTNPTNTPAPTATLTPAPTTSAQSPTATPTPIPSTTFSNDGINVRVSCSGSNMSISVTSRLTASSSNGGIWGAIVDNNTSNKMIYTFIGTPGYYTDYNISANFPPTGAIRGSTIDLIADGRSYSTRAYYAPFSDNMPTLGDPFARVDFSKTCP